MDTKTKIIFFIILFIFIIGCCIASFFLGRIGKDGITKQLAENVKRATELKTTISDLKTTISESNGIIKKLGKEQQQQSNIIGSIRKENIQLKNLNRQDSIIIRELSKNNKELSSSIDNIRITGQTIGKLIEKSLSILQNENSNK